MVLDAILERNRAYLQGRKRRPWPANPRVQLAVVACYDPRLDEMIRESIGIEPGEAFVFRTAGAFLREGSSSLRSLAVAIYFFGVTHVLVMGHRSCRMADFDTAGFIDAFRRRGVAREAFGAEDLRAWAGAIADPRRGVEATVANLRGAPFLPRDLSIAGVVLDDETGALEVVLRPGQEPAAERAAEPAEAETGIALPAAPGAEAEIPREAPPARAAAQRPPGSAGGEDALLRTASNLRRLLRTADGWRAEAQQLQTRMARQHPLVKLDLLEEFLKQTLADSRQVSQVMDELRESGRVLRDPEELVRLVLRRARES
jgi:carbonic anhydrase